MTPRTDAALEALRALDAAASPGQAHRLNDCARCAAEDRLTELAKEGHLLRAMEALNETNTDIVCGHCEQPIEQSGDSWIGLYCRCRRHRPCRHRYWKDCKACAVLTSLADALLGPEEAKPHA